MSEVLKKHCNPSYIAMSNYHLMDKSLSLKAKGLLTIMLALPNDWNYSVDELVKLSNDGRTAVRTTLQELERHNYLFRKRVYLKNQISDIEYHVFETPTDEETRLRLDFLTLENLTLENKPNPINNPIKDINKDSIKKPIQDIKDNKVYTGNRPKRELFKTKDSVQEIIDYYQANCTGLKQLRVFTDSRKKAVRDILRKYGPDTVKEVLDKAQSSRFLKGETGTWKCGFDWLFKEQNFVKVLEGNYDETYSNRKKDKFAEAGGKVKSVPVDRSKKEKYLEELRKNGERTEY